MGENSLLWSSNPAKSIYGAIPSTVKLITITIFNDTWQLCRHVQRIVVCRRIYWQLDVKWWFDRGEFDGCWCEKLTWCDVNLPIDRWRYVSLLRNWNTLLFTRVYFFFFWRSWVVACRKVCTLLGGRLGMDWQVGWRCLPLMPWTLRCVRRFGAPLRYWLIFFFKYLLSIGIFYIIPV